ncbi:WXG100-like domain-containing protein [Williamsia sp. SKLECPSW1]
MSLPGGLQFALGFIGGGFTYPEGDEDALHDMGDAYAQASVALRSAGADVLAGSESLGSVITGDVHHAMVRYFGEIAGPRGVDGLADNFAKCELLCDATAVSVIVAKSAFVLTLEVFAVQLALDIALAAETFGASMAAAVAEGALTGAVLRTIIERLVSEITTHISAAVLKEIGRDVVAEIARSAAQSAIKEGVRQVIAHQFFMDRYDAGQIAEKTADGAISAGVGAVAAAPSTVLYGSAARSPGLTGTGRTHSEPPPPHAGGNAGSPGPSPSPRPGPGGGAGASPQPGSPPMPPPGTRTPSRARRGGQAPETPESVGAPESVVASEAYDDATQEGPEPTPEGSSALNSSPISDETMTAQISSSIPSPGPSGSFAGDPGIVAEVHQDGGVRTASATGQVGSGGSTVGGLNLDTTEADRGR